MELRESPPAIGRRFLLVVIVGAVLPLGLVGVWTTTSAARSGRALLGSQLQATLSQTVTEISARWAERRSDLLLLSENEPVRAMLARGDTGSAVPPFVADAWKQMTAFDRVVIRDRANKARIVLTDVADDQRPDNNVTQRSGVLIRLPIVDLMSGDTIGSVDGVLRASVLLPSVVTPPSANAPIAAMFVPSGDTIVPPLVDPRIFSDESVRWNGQHWMSVRRQIADPPVEIAVAGTLDPYVAPFQRSARAAALELLAVALGVIGLVWFATRRLARGIERELARREALATVGEFASELAHEVRNPLTSVRLDLQRIGEVSGDPSAVQRIAGRVLGQIDRIDHGVTGALRVARGGSMERRPVDLRTVLERAAHSAAPEFTKRDATLVVDAGAVVCDVDADAAALEQAMLNLLLNAAQALEAGGVTHVRLDRAGSVAVATVADEDVGMTPEQLRLVEQPFRSSKRDGTGLGLRIARRIIDAHQGRLAIESSPGRGTTVSVQLPLSSPG